MISIYHIIMISDGPMRPLVQYYTEGRDREEGKTKKREIKYRQREKE